MSKKKDASRCYLVGYGEDAALHDVERWVEAGRRAVEAAEVDEPDQEYGIADAIVAILHYAATQGHSAAAILASAEGHAQTEMGAAFHDATAFAKAVEENGLESLATLDEPEVAVFWKPPATL